MMSLVHEHNRSMNAHHAAKRARIAAGHTPPQPQFSGGHPCTFSLPYTPRQNGQGLYAIHFIFKSWDQYCFSHRRELLLPQPRAPVHVAATHHGR